MSSVSRYEIQSEISDDIGRAYAQLALAVEQHMPGYIDAYFGPPEWKAAAQAAGKQPLSELSQRARELASAAQSTSLPPARARFLRKQVRAMQTSLRLLSGEQISFLDEVRSLYDIEPERVDEQVFEDALRELETLLPGDGPMTDRLRARRRRFEIPRERALDLFHIAKDETGRRTRALFALPTNEDVDITLVNDKPWGAYNWYLGRHRSLIEMNTDSPVHTNALVGLLAHEGYPGHHTEHAIKEQVLFEQRRWVESCTLLINAPECVISEGIATSAAEVIFEDGELERWQREHLYPACGVHDELPPDVVGRVQQLSRVLGGTSDNAALMLHVDGRSRDEVLEYLLRYGTRTREEYQRSIRFMTDPVFRSYTFTYSAGHRLLEQLFARHDKIELFRRLLSEPLTPADLREWISAAPGAASNHA